MTIEEKAKLELARANAKLRCDEVYRTIQQLKGILSDYFKDYHRWRKRFEEADRALAMNEKLTKLPEPWSKREKKKETETVVPLTKKQILEIADVLGIKLELNFDEEDEEVDDANETSP